MVLSDRPVRTPKYLYALARRCPVVSPLWLQVLAVIRALRLASLGLYGRSVRPCARLPHR